MGLLEGDYKMEKIIIRKQNGKYQVDIKGFKGKWETLPEVLAYITGYFDEPLCERKEKYDDQFKVNLKVMGGLFNGIQV